VGQERDTTVKVQQSTGNVFRDLEFGAQEAESLRLRAELMVEVRRLIQARKLTQRSAANLLGVTQPRISDLIRGKIDLFSIDTLVNMLARAGMRVQLRIAGGRGRRAQAA
jgi:predicted XRE-type DNA-binding protein